MHGNTVVWLSADGGARQAVADQRMYVLDARHRSRVIVVLRHGRAQTHPPRMRFPVLNLHACLEGKKTKQ